MVLGCQTVEIPNVRIHKEIPFLDAPEAVYVETTSHVEGFLTNQEWVEIRPYLLCVDDKGWAEIKRTWLQACRIAGPKCNIMVDSVDQIIRQLDDIARRVLQP